MINPFPLQKPQQQKNSNRKRSKFSSSQIAILIIGGFFSFILLCSLGVLVLNEIFPTRPASTPIVKNIALEQVVAMTANAAQLQTQAFYTPTLPPPTSAGTSTFTPTVTMLPTATLSEFEMQTAQAWATYYANPTSIITPFYVFPTSDGELYIPPSDNDIPSNNGVCSCSDDTLNCGDFSTRDAAQACYENCVSQGYGDIHRLDQGGKKGVACETYKY